jgi:ribokinase
MSDAARICVIGSITMDLVARAPRLPRPGETVLGTSFGTFEGGKGANQAVAAARMGAGVSLVGAVGDDDYGRRALAALAAEGLNLERVSVRPGVPTGVSLIGIGENGENSIIATSGANWTITPADIEAARPTIAEADALLLQLEIPMESVLRAAAIAQDVGTPLLLNAAPGMRLSAELLAAAEVLVVNRSEAEIITGHIVHNPPTFCTMRATSRIAGEPEAPAAWPEDDEALKGAMGRLCMLHAPTAILTLGADGCALIRESSAMMIEAFPVEAIDTVGAGDAFCGAFAVRYAENTIGGGGQEGILDALHWASAAGAIAATRPGAIPSMPTRADIRRLLTRI